MGGDADRLRGFVFVLIHNHAGVLSNLRQSTGNGFTIHLCFVQCLSGKSNA